MEIAISEAFRDLAPYVGLAFLAVALVFVYRSFFAMRIDKKDSTLLINKSENQPPRFVSPETSVNGDSVQPKVGQRIEPIQTDAERSIV